VEHWNHWARIRQDLFGFADVLAVRQGETLAVQCTTVSNQSARLDKLRGMDTVKDCIRAGWRVEVWGWHKYAKPDERGRYWQVTRTVVDG
jgi:hypothetical protein